MGGNVNHTSGEPVSRVDFFTGKHTTSILVAILFVITFIGLIVLVCVKDKVPENLQTALVGILGMLAGFFAGTNTKSK